MGDQELSSIDAANVALREQQTESLRNHDASRRQASATNGSVSGIASVSEQPTGDASNLPLGVPKSRSAKYVPPGPKPNFSLAHVDHDRTGGLPSKPTLPTHD